MLRGNSSSLEADWEGSLLEGRLQNSVAVGECDLLKYGMQSPLWQHDCMSVPIAQIICGSYLVQLCCADHPSCFNYTG